MPHSHHYPMYIDGQWVDTDRREQVVNPATGDVVATTAFGGVKEADLAVEAARSAYERGAWRSRPPEKRAETISAMAEHLAGRSDDLIRLATQENGVTVRQARAFYVGTAISNLRYFADLARTYPFERTGPTLSSPTLATGIVRREPIGVVAGIVPWNFPMLLAVWKLGPALAAGNSIVIKPDESTPLTLLEIARAADEVGVPPGVFNVVLGAGEEVGQRLARHPSVRKIAFTGSTEVGKLIMQAAASNVKRVTLELGGKGPNVVLDDADLDAAVDAALFACFMHAGQACESGTRLLLPESLHDMFVERMIARARTLTIGDPLDPATDMGPVMSARQRERIEHYIELGQREGATLAYQGDLPGDPALKDGNWVAPTIFTNVRNDMTIAREEIFGPVLCVIKYDDEDQAVAIANDTEYGLSAGVWSRDTARALRVAQRLEAGTVWVNDWHMVNSQYPFGGYKQSGIGRELGPSALDEYTEEKFVHVDMTNDVSKRAYGLLFSTPAPPAGDVPTNAT